MLSYLRMKGLPFVEDGAMITGKLESGEEIRMEFNDSGGIVSLNGGSFFYFQLIALIRMNYVRLVPRVAVLLPLACSFRLTPPIRGRASRGFSDEVSMTRIH